MGPVVFPVLLLALSRAVPVIGMLRVVAFPLPESCNREQVTCRLLAQSCAPLIWCNGSAVQTAQPQALQ